MAGTPEHRSIIDVLTEDHREVEKLFGEALATEDATLRREVADQIITELVRHSVAEEQYLYPAVRHHVDHGDQRADREIADHAEAEQIMKQMEGLEENDLQLPHLLRRLESDVARHVEEEENEVFPQLRARVDGAGLVELGEKVQRAKELAPTRPHPSAPDTPPLNKIVGPGAGLIDRVRDRLAQLGA